MQSSHLYVYRLSHWLGGGWGGGNGDPALESYFHKWNILAPQPCRPQFWSKNKGVGLKLFQTLFHKIFIKRLLIKLKLFINFVFKFTFRKNSGQGRKVINTCKVVNLMIIM